MANAIMQRDIPQKLRGAMLADNYFSIFISKLANHPMPGWLE
jgi:hypothetical protein